MEIKDILCPVDFSACSGRALDQAVALAKLFGARIHLLHVYIDPLSSVPFGREGTAGSPSAPPEVILDARQKRADEVKKLQTLVEQHGVHVKVEELEGEAKKAIPEYAEQSDVDLIVMGTHGRTKVARLLMGSVAERVLRTAVCPVMTVP